VPKEGETKKGGWLHLSRVFQLYPLVLPFNFRGES